MLSMVTLFLTAPAGVEKSAGMHPCAPGCNIKSLGCNIESPGCKVQSLGCNIGSQVQFESLKLIVESLK